MKILKIILTTCAVTCAGTVFAGDTPSPDGAAVYFVNVADGDTIKSGSTVVFGLTGMGVAPAGIDMENTGHHHLLLNRDSFGDAADDADWIAYGIPADDNHKHFGKGQTEVALELEAGTHTLQLVLGDMSHIPHDPIVMSERITITVE